MGVTSLHKNENNIKSKSRILDPYVLFEFYYPLKNKHLI